MSEALPKDGAQPTAQPLAQPASTIAPNSAQIGPIDQTPRARAIREILRIAGWYGWQGEIIRALDTAEQPSLQQLETEQIESLLARMRQLEDCVQIGAGSPDSPPAR